MVECITMARPLRLQYPGAVYHLTSRGNRQEDIFVSDRDRVAFLTILGQTLQRYNWRCHAYCLMDNHYHLVVETPHANLAVGMRQLNGVYTQHSNKTHQRAGHLFQGRYKSILVEKDQHLLELCRHVVLNPVRVGLCDHPGKWQWSSFQATSTMKEESDCLSPDWLLKQFGENRVRAAHRYAQFVLEGCTDATCPWDRLKAQVVFGSDHFLGTIKEMLAEQRQAKEVPVSQRHVDRPGLDLLFSGKAASDKRSRNAGIVRASLEYGYTLKQIADHLGLHYSTVSKIISARKMQEVTLEKTETDPGFM